MSSRLQTVHDVVSTGARSIRPSARVPAQWAGDSETAAVRSSPLVVRTIRSVARSGRASGRAARSLDLPMRTRLARQRDWAVALTVGSVLRGTILNYAIIIGHYRGPTIQQPINM